MGDGCGPASADREACPVSEMSVTVQRADADGRGQMDGWMDGDDHPGSRSRAWIQALLVHSRQSQTTPRPGDAERRCNRSPRDFHSLQPLPHRLPQCNPLHASLLLVSFPTPRMPPRQYLGHGVRTSHPTHASKTTTRRRSNGTHSTDPGPLADPVPIEEFPPPAWRTVLNSRADLGELTTASPHLLGYPSHPPSVQH